MDRDRLKEIKSQIRGGSVSALTKYLDYLYSESLEKTLTTREDHRFHQSRTTTIQEILNLLPKTSE